MEEDVAGGAGKEAEKEEVPKPIVVVGSAFSVAVDFPA